ncbi:monovalent cation/H(+) antiporter subunit G [Lacicoccus alkaliphilus]|uniref:Multisubunit sodium/proton antiporter, MrpG subunit n=2 Tax=Lacicoccus TaxID=3076172 RepID=A0A1M7FJD0_9BACL|nr:monovalent cation/H(+) antiporter subunit G [Salinicoccus alkaliphilus]SHM04154.1 multisubunit sodium/proton antiporter, MrpG subunit [Salinicoccus alkaliphilus DSM 16010]
MTMTELIVSFFVIVGSFFIFVSSIGILRLRDVYSRTHAGGKSSTLGVMSIMTGVVLFFWVTEGNFNLNLMLTIIFVFMTAPLAALAVNRSAYRTNVPMTDETSIDELGDAMDMEREKEAMENLNKK